MAPKLLDPDALRTALAGLPSWELAGDRLRRT